LLRIYPGHSPGHSQPRRFVARNLFRFWLPACRQTGGMNSALRIIVNIVLSDFAKFKDYFPVFFVSLECKNVACSYMTFPNTRKTLHRLNSQ
ncbi:MAG: hypothetical protein ACOYYJ_18855, partial [Chloroflexota bacterium]